MMSRRSSRLAVLLLPLALAGCLDEPIQGGDSYYSRDVAEFSSQEYRDLPLSAPEGVEPAASVVENCVYDGYIDTRFFSGCALQDVPFIGMLATDPDVDTIMTRVLVSRPWMAARFREVLEALPPQALQLFRPVTAIVISHDIRPSFYWAVTGAIYIDPGYLWMTQAEFEETPQHADFRSGYGDLLSFDEVYRYVDGNSYATEPNTTYAGDRAFRAVLLGVARLLAHELAHANDYVSGQAAISAHPTQTPWTVARGNFVSVPGDTYGISFPGDYYYGPILLPRLSGRLASAYPLYDSVLECAARQMFANECRSAEAYAPDHVSSSFRIAAANDLYNFTRYQEDVAMLFEEFFMQHYFGIRRDHAITNNPPAGATADDYIVDWGQRGRIGDELLRPRIQLLVGAMLPTLDAWAVVNALPEPVELVAGNSWLDNLEPTAGITDGLQKQQLLRRGMREDRLQPWHPPLPGDSGD